MSRFEIIRLLSRRTSAWLAGWRKMGTQHANSAMSNSIVDLSVRRPFSCLLRMRGVDLYTCWLLGYWHFKKLGERKKPYCSCIRSCLCTGSQDWVGIMKVEHTWKIIKKRFYLNLPTEAVATSWPRLASFQILHPEQQSLLHNSLLGDPGFSFLSHASFLLVEWPAHFYYLGIWMEKFFFLNISTVQ
jgi:hypothetical protein